MSREDTDSDGLSVGRREVIGVGGLTAVAGFAFHDDLREFFEDDTPAEDAEASSPEDENVIDDAVEAHIEYREEITSPRPRASFSYDGIDIRETNHGESVELIAAPASSGRGDRIVLTPPESVAIDEVARTFLAYWGTPLEEEFATARVFDREITFVGGDGNEIAAAAATVSVPDRGESVLAVRGESTELARELAETFEAGIDIFSES